MTTCLKAGAKTNPRLTSGVWNDAAYTYSNVEWFGTQHEGSRSAIGRA